MKNIKKILVMIIILFSILSTINAIDNSYSKLSETLLNQDPDPAEPGEYVEIRFKIEKEGNNILENIEYELITEYPFSFDDSDNSIKNLGNWIGNSDDKEFYILYYKLKIDNNAIEGNYELTLKQKSTSNNLEKEIDFNIRVGESQMPELLIGNVNTAPAKLIADYNEATLNVEIVNSGEEDAKQVIAEIILPNGFEKSFGYSTRKNLGTITAGNSVIVDFYFDTLEELLMNSYNTSIKLTYKEDTSNSENEIKTIELPFVVDVFGRPSYEIQVIEVDKLHPSDLSKTFKVSVKNIGSLKSDSTSVQVFKDSSQPFNFNDKSDFIGTLDVGEVAESVFVFDIDDNAASKDYRLKLQIRSVVDGDVLVEDEVVILNIEAKTKNPISQNPNLRYAFYIVFLIIGIVIGRRLKKDNNNKIINKK